MKLNLTQAFFTALFILCMTHITQAQNLVRGKVIDGKTGEVMVGATVVIKGTTTGVQTDYDGLFDMKVSQSYPVKLTVSFVGYETTEIEVPNSNIVTVKLGDQALAIDVVEVKGQRISDKQKAAPMTVESMDKLAIKQAAAISFYEGMGNLKGVDLTTASIGFTIINTRGFNSTSPVRSLQIIDGVDNQSPGLNFSLGNFLGASELDVLKADLIVGANSAYYGPNAFNGVLSMETKNPFFQKGLSVQMKTGERNLVQGAFRYADAIKNAKGYDWLAYKVNAFYMKAYDWEADNYTPIDDSRVPANNPGRFDAVNIYGDEYAAELDYSGSKYTTPVGLGNWYRTGYKEKELVDYNTKNLKANAAVHFRLQPSLVEKSPELIISGNLGNGTTVYQGDNRFSLRDILFWQGRIELKKRDKYFLRAYMTQEDAGRSFDPYFTALVLQQKTGKTMAGWRADYTRFWLRDIQPRIDRLEFPYGDAQKADAWYLKYNDSLALWHSLAQTYTDNTSTINGEPFFAPGTERFQAEFERITSLKSNKKNVTGAAANLDDVGTRFFDQSALYHVQGEYKFNPEWTNEITVGGNIRQYKPNSDGTIFYDTNGTRISNFEYGIYGGIEKKVMDNKIKLNATLRMDKNQNFGYLFSPAASIVYQPNNKDFLRLTFSSAIRNPTLTDQYLYLNVGRAILSGNLTGQNDLITVESFRNFINTGRQKDSLVYFNIPAIKPEKVKTIELGYRTTLFDNTFVDANYYFSIYKDFIGYNLGIRSEFDALTNFPKNTQAYRYSANSINTVTTQGFSIGINHYFAKYYQLNGNYSWNKLNKTFDNDPIIPAYNTPEHKFNIGISARDFVLSLGKKKIENLSFNFNYKWVKGFVFEGSPQFTGYIPTYALLDGQISYTAPKIYTTFKLGASNVLNNKVFQTYGGPRIGRMAYFSILYDFTKKI